MTPTDVQKQAILHPHVFYCIDQLAGLFLDLPDQNLKGFAVNAVVESRAINARNLLIFFECSTRKNDDVICADFGFASNIIHISGTVRSRFNKDISHLTYSRIRNYEYDREWPYHEFVPPILERSVVFIDHLFESKQVPVELADEWRGLRELAAGVAKALRPMTE